MKKQLVRYLLIIPLTLGLIATVCGQSDQPSGSLARASELWEMAVEAKGGRERLNQIDNLAIIYGGVTFLVFPDKYFDWFDMRPSEFGLSTTILNFESGFGFETYPHNKRKVFSDVKNVPGFTCMANRFLEEQIRHLLETKWLHPKPIRASTATVRGKSVDRVDVLVDWCGDPSRKVMRYAVFLDRETHLPVRIGMVYYPNKDDLLHWTDFRNYQEIGGIKVATQTSYGNPSHGQQKWNNVRLEINAEYDPKVFDREPDLNAGPFQWRKPGAAQVAPPIAATNIAPSFTAEQIGQLIKDLKSADAAVVKSAQYDLIAAGRQAVPALTNLLQSSDSLLRYRAAFPLLRIDSENAAATQVVAALVLDSKLDVQDRQDAAFGLLRNDKGITILTDLLAHPDAVVRRYAIFAFDQLTERAEIPRQVKKAIPALRKLLKDKDQIVRGMAEEVLEQIRNRFKR
jgi:hypothetical protein